MKKNYFIPALLLFSNGLFAQDPEQNNPIVFNDQAHPCVDSQTYQSIEAEIMKNRKLLGLDKATTNSRAVTLLEWPLRPAAALTDCDYYYISAFVDQDNTAGIKDWNCGSRTYDGHRGIDIVPWPFIWNNMDNELVEVIAAATGTITAKVDGNPDRICDGVGGGSNSNNYITIQHADGSTALYIHLKTGSFTNKTVGQTVSTGEFLGIVGSAGQSTGVHLHFEIRSDGTFANYVDPFDGACNNATSTTWWASQKPYTEPKIIKLSLHSSWPYMASCPNTTDTTYEEDNYVSNPGSQATFYACSKHVLTGDTWNFRILNPDNSVFDSWNYTSTSNRNTSTLGWNKTLPVTPGVYSYEGTFNSITCAKSFTIQATTDVQNVNEKSTPFTLFPNPNTGTFHILQFDNSNLYAGSDFKIYNELGIPVYESTLTEQNQAMNIDLEQGIYFFSLFKEGKEVHKGKLIIN